MYIYIFVYNLYVFVYERDFCDINHAQWRWGRGADLSTTRRPHINIRRIRGNLHTELPTPESIKQRLIYRQVGKII